MSSPGSQADGATISPSELKSLTQNSVVRNAGAERPCYEAEDSACRGEWRREAGSPREGGAQCQPGKERVANSHPPFVPA